MRMYDRTNIPLLAKALDAYALRQKVIGNNIANITTPGYKCQAVSFEKELAAVIGSTQEIKLRLENPGVPASEMLSPYEYIEPRVYELSKDATSPSNPYASGFNDVDIDQEMVELAKNQIRFKFGARFVGEMFKGIQKAIRGTLS